MALAARAPGRGRSSPIALPVVPALGVRHPGADAQGGREGGTLASAVLKTPRTLAPAAAISATLVSAGNWAIFIWAVDQRPQAGRQPRLLHQSADEHGRRRDPVPRAVQPDWAGASAIALACRSAWPCRAWRSATRYVWLALSLAVTFWGYGVDPQAEAGQDAQAGLFVECLVLAPLALGYIVWIAP